MHLLASNSPLKIPTVEQAIERMPEAAKKDMLEWVDDRFDLKFAWSLVLGEFRPVENFLPKDRSIVITDDRPFNEYFWLRRTLGDR